MEKPSKKTVLLVLGGIVVVLFALLIISLLFFLPDLIWLIRTKLESLFSCITIIDIEGKTVSPETYLEIILGIIECFLTAFLAIMAYKLSKDIGKIQIGEQSAKHMLWATKVVNFVESNLKIVHNAKKSVPQLLKDLDDDDKELYAQYIINLKSSNLIDENSRKTLEEFIIKIKNLKELHTNGDTQTDSSLNAIANYYLDLGYPETTYKKNINDLIEKLKIISEKGEK